MTIQKNTKYNQELLEEYNTILLIRDRVNKMIEDLMQKGEIKQSSEVDFSFLPSNDKEKEINNKYIYILSLIYGIAKFEISKSSNAKKTTYTKCDRCWNYYEKTSEIEENHLCDRWKEVMESYEGNN